MNLLNDYKFNKIKKLNILSNHKKTKTKINLKQLIQLKKKLYNY